MGPQRVFSVAQVVGSTPPCNSRDADRCAATSASAFRHRHARSAGRRDGQGGGGHQDQGCGLRVGLGECREREGGKGSGRGRCDASRRDGRRRVAGPQRAKLVAVQEEVQRYGHRTPQRRPRTSRVARSHASGLALLLGGAVRALATAAALVVRQLVGVTWESAPTPRQPTTISSGRLTTSSRPCAWARGAWDAKTAYRFLERRALPCCQCRTCAGGLATWSARRPCHRGCVLRR